MLLRILTIAAILATFAFLAPHAAAAPLDQHHGNGVHVGVGVGNHHGGNVVVVNRGFRYPWGFRGFGPGFGFAPFVPVVALPPPVIPVALPVPVSVPVAVPQVNYAPAVPTVAPCGCP